MANENTSHKEPQVKMKLAKLKEEPKKIDSMLSNVENPVFDPLLLRRLKKQKLILKDKIQRISSQLTPNIIA